ncbi:thioesterase-like superfamily-domain-containing protein [Naematelia encephala]|uniref:Thioesterase-like superfamily-domain-containing protein n=1 Tax=Naematelia encephala TaxID=71784 RepID=A0A1Y2BDK8_9TREE|nr:thioesterase-like superfamily-domain-containing protein [Naematelia encephala]
MASTLSESVSVRQIAPNTFRAEPFHERARQGNAMPIAYGGLVLSQSISAASATVPSFDLYSVQGTYLGPSSTEHPTIFRVTDIRTTRTFCTRLVIASQSQSQTTSTFNEERKTLIALLDYHATEPVSLLEYSTPPMYPFEEYGIPEELPGFESHIPPDGVDAFKKMFTITLDFYDLRGCGHSIGVSTAMGFAPDKPSAEDDLPITRRTNCTWVRTRENLGGPRENAAGVAMIMDAVLSFLPLTVTRQPLTAAAAASSLDFSLHFHTPVDLSKWHLHEQHTTTGTNGRTMSQGILYDRTGREVAVMTQMSILRPLPKGRGRL